MKLTVKTIPIAKIDTRDRLLPFDKAWAETLSGLIDASGLQTPIEIYPSEDRYVLNAGLHRLAACRLLEWTSIPAVVLDAKTASEAHTLRMREVLENLGRRELSVLDRAVSFLELKRIHLEQNPETGHGKKRKRQANENVGENKVAILATLSPRFTESASERCGLSERAIQRLVAIAERLEPAVREKIHGTPLANHQSDLIKLSEQKPAVQQKVIDLVLAENPQAKTVGEALDKLAAKPVPSQTDRIYTGTINSFARLSRAQQDAFFSHHEADVRRFAKAQGWL